MTDIYAEFGVNNAVMTSIDVAEHEQNMLKLNVDARDGDDAITLEEPEEVELTEGEEQEEDGEEESQEDPQEEQEAQPEEGEFTLLPEAPDELKSASEAISKYADGFTALRDQAIKAGLTEAQAAQVEAEYETEHGLSEASYAALEKAGYSRSFVDSYIQGQESIAEQFVAKVTDYAGGKDKFNRIVGFMQASNPESVTSLYEAIERQDLGTIRTIINLGIQGHTKKFGKAPSRNLTKSAPASSTKRSVAQAEGYTSRSAMVADMSKPEYRMDPAFRAKVEARVAASTF